MNTLELSTIEHNRLLTVEEVVQLLKIGKSSLYQGIKVGIYPKPVKIGPRLVRWRVSDISNLLEGLSHVS